MKPDMTPDERDRLEEAGLWCLRHADGGLTEADRAAFAAWLDADPRNRAAFDDSSRTWRLLDHASFEPRVIEHRRAALSLFRLRNAARWSLPWPGRRALAAASALVVCFGALILVRTLPVEYRTAVGERRVAVLSDGSKISLDAATVVRVRYSGTARELRLERGRAKFDVAHDTQRPFTVAAADKIVLATGTQFSVEQLGRAIHVVLYDGHVAVLTRSPTPGGAPTPLMSGSDPVARRLAPGRELVTAVAATTGAIVASDPGRSLSWEAGQLVFEDELLGAAVERINRYSRQTLAVGDARAARLRVNGVYNAGDTLAFVEGVTGVLPLRVARHDGGFTLTSRE